MGYDLDALMKDRNRCRINADLRAVVWSIYRRETGFGAVVIGSIFNRSRNTVNAALIRADNLMLYDKEFIGLYDMVYSYYMQYESE